MNVGKAILLISCLAIGSNVGTAQDMKYTQEIIQKLCSAELEGRGYVNDGVNKSADFLASEFRRLKLNKFGSSYFQSFRFDINTFPTPILCKLDKRKLYAGKDFLLSPESGRCAGTYNLFHFDLADSVDRVLFDLKKESTLNADDAFVLKNVPANFEAHTNSIFIESKSKKMIHSLSQEASNTCSLIFPDSIIDNASVLQIEANNKMLNGFTSKNLIGYIPAANKKNRQKYIVFTGHYDHLGRMGEAIFPGASDNASGISMLLNLAKHFSKKKNDYSIVFILFAGEEAGLIGSNYFVQSPTFPLENIQVLINLDIMGSAEDGVTVVNATEFPTQFDRLKKINDQKKYLPQIKTRGKAQNSDHYYFSEKGVPAFFLYSNGGPGFYHDVMDKPETLPLTNYNGVFKLLVDFVETM